MTDLLIDGQPATALAADDRGLLYGDGLFETLAFVAGVGGPHAPLWARHMARLQRDARRLGLQPPPAGQLAEECARVVGDRSRAMVRITLTRGSGGRGYWPAEEGITRRLVQCRAWPEGLEEAHQSGLRLHTSPIRLARGGALAGIKHLNRLEQVLAARAAAQAGMEEAVLLDSAGQVVEAISSNLVLWVDGRIITPPLEQAGVAGTGLDWLRELAGDGLLQAPADAALLERVEAMMMINSVAGIRPVRELDGRSLKIPHRLRHWQELWAELFACEN